jgi:hypothetical protein
MRRWAEFEIQGTNGGQRNWHWVTQDKLGYVGRCGRRLTGKPIQTSVQKPNLIRGLCRLCERYQALPAKKS